MNTRSLLFPACFGVLLLSLLAGCASWNKPVSDSFASVTITNTTAIDVQAVTIQVFRAHQYQLAKIDPNTHQMVFERQGTYGQSLAYNGIYGTQNGQGILDRVKTNLSDLGDGTCILGCQAYVVQDANSAFVAQEIKLSNLRSRPYQDILDKIKFQLNPPEKKK